MSPLRRLHGWRAPGINTHRYRLRVCGVCERGRVFFFFQLQPHTRGMNGVSSLFNLSLLFIFYVALLLFLSPPVSPRLPPRMHGRHLLWTSHPPSEKKKKQNSTAEARFNCPGGGKLNKAVREKFLPLPFHLNLWLLAVVLLSAATHWEAWNEKCLLRLMRC